MQNFNSWEMKTKGPFLAATQREILPCLHLVPCRIRPYSGLRLPYVQSVHQRHLVRGEKAHLQNPFRRHHRWINSSTGMTPSSLQVVLLHGHWDPFCWPLLAGLRGGWWGVGSGPSSTALPVGIPDGPYAWPCLSSFHCDGVLRRVARCYSNQLHCRCWKSRRFDSHPPLGDIRWERGYAHRRQRHICPKKNRKN